MSAHRNGIHVDMTKKPALYTNANATPIPKWGQLQGIKLPTCERAFHLPIMLPIIKDAKAPPTTKMTGIIISVYQRSVRVLANIRNAHMPISNVLDHNSLQPSMLSTTCWEIYQCCEKH